IINRLNDELIKINGELNSNVLCEEKNELNGKCGNKQITRFLYECKQNANVDEGHYIQWIPFHELGNIEYLAKGSFGEVHKATRTGYRDVALKRIYNSSDKILDI